MHSAYGYDDVVSAVLAAAGRCLGTKTEALVRHSVAEAVCRWFAAEDAAQCTCVSMRDFARQKCCSSVLWAHAEQATSLPGFSFCALPQAWATVRCSCLAVTGALWLVYACAHAGLCQAATPSQHQARGPERAAAHSSGCTAGQQATHRSRAATSSCSRVYSGSSRCSCSPALGGGACQPDCSPAGTEQGQGQETAPKAAQAGAQGPGSAGSC